MCEEEEQSFWRFIAGAPMMQHTCIIVSSYGIGSMIVYHGQHIIAISVMKMEMELQIASR
eukprot:COSAG05_NODE_2309_length_3245_cov_2.315003_3_plen_60_part_00